MCGASWPKKSQELREYILRKTIRDQRLLPAQNNRDDCEITNDGQTDLRAEETSCKNMKSIQENLTLAKEIPSQNAEASQTGVVLTLPT